MLPRFDYGDTVRLIRNVRNDGTFPGKEVGDLLIRRGAVGFVRAPPFMMCRSPGCAVAVNSHTLPAMSARP